MIPLFLLSGFFIPAKDCPYYFLPFQYLSWFYYGTENMLINQWTASQVCVSLDITQGIFLQILLRRQFETEITVDRGILRSRDKNFGDRARSRL